MISEWINNYFKVFIAAGNPYARRPSPKDGDMLEQTWGTLSWSPGDWAVSHDVYIGTNFDDVNDGAADTFVGNVAQAMQIVGFVGFPFPDGLVPGTTYYWRVDEVNDADPNSPWKGPVWSFSIPPRKAYEPSPGDGCKFILPDAALSWAPGHEAKLHMVYFGDDYDAVANATAGAQSMTAATYSPGPLEIGRTYYWRVDEFNPPITEKGDVWSFTTLPEIPISDPDLVAWWKLDEGGGATVVDWSGHGNHGTLQGDPEWTDGIDAGALDLDGGGDYVNFRGTSDLPAGTSARTLCGWGKTNTVAGGWRWIAAYGTEGTSLAMFIGMNGTSLYGGGYGDDVPLSGLSGFWEVDVWHHICLTYDGTTARLYADGILVASEAKTWDLPLSRAHIGRQVNNAAEFWNGLVDDVRIYSRVLTPDEIAQVMRGDTTRAWNESPANNSISDVFRAASVSWSAGDSASQHAVYFGTDKEAVADADESDTAGIFRGKQAGTSYTPPEGVAWGGGSYYWRVDEHNTDGTITTGTVWTFTVADYVLVDDFEAYNDIPAGESGSNLVYVAWVDGFENPNVNGSTMGYVTGASMETGNVHGGNKSVPFQFNNTTAGVSEVVLTLTPAQDWTAHGIITLSLWFAGDATNVPGQLYVKVNGVQVNYDGDASNLTRSPWQVWNIDLTAINTNLSRVTSLAIGIQGPGATGILLLDDIRLYAQARELVTPVQPDPAGLVAQYAFEGNANDSVGGHHGTINGSPLYPLGKFGQAIALDGIDDHVVIGSVGISGVQPRTIAGWAKASILGTPAWVNVFGFTGPSGDNGHFDIELVGDTSTTTLGWYGLHVYGWEQDIMPIDLEWHHL
ncbi:MAG: LamG domain-containing protein, partial [Phycisphaerales bacterium]